LLFFINKSSHFKALIVGKSSHQKTELHLFASATSLVISLNVLYFQKTPVTHFLVDTTYHTDLEMKEQTSSSAIAVMCMFLFLQPSGKFILLLFVGTFSLGRVEIFSMWSKLFTEFINLICHHQALTFLQTDM
jgi:hypothetical protein